MCVHILTLEYPARVYPLTSVTHNQPFCHLQRSYAPINVCEVCSGGFSVAADQCLLFL